MLGFELLCHAFKVVLVTSGKFLLFLFETRQCSSKLLLICDELCFQGIPLLRMESLKNEQCKHSPSATSFSIGCMAVFLLNSLPPFLAAFGLGLHDVAAQ